MVDQTASPLALRPFATRSVEDYELHVVVDEKEVAMRPRLLIVNHRTALREALAALAEMHDVDVIGAAPTGAEAVEMAARDQPDAIVVDSDVGEGGWWVLPSLKAAAPAATVIVYGALEDLSLPEAILHAGADAYFDRGTDSVATIFAYIIPRASRPPGDLTRRRTA